jgi:hypothetical protein
MTEQSGRIVTNKLNVQYYYFLLIHLLRNDGEAIIELLLKTLMEGRLLLFY